MSAPLSEHGVPEEAAALPLIVVSDRPLRELSDACLTCLLDANRPTPTVFQRGGALVRIRRDGGQLTTEVLTPAGLKGRLERAANFVRASARGMFPSRLPDDVVRDLLALPEWPFPDLRAIARSPVVLPDLRVLTSDGYDAASGVYLAAGLSGPLSLDMEITGARRWIEDELLGDFPFSDQSSRAHAVALLLQPLVRLLIDGLTPQYLVEAPTHGTGKGLLVEVLGMVTLGRRPGVMAEAGDEAEMRKRITALLMAGQEMVVLDNLYALRSGVLSAALTAEIWEDRILGHSRVVRLENRAVWIATGNNIGLSDEHVRRVVPIRLDAQVERPEERTGFRHSDLGRLAREHRPELLSAALSIIKSWIDAGCPDGDRTLGRFEGWARVMGGILDVAGIEGFLGNRDRLYAVSDRDTIEWVAFCEAWAQRYGPTPVTAKDLLSVAVESDLLLDLRAGRSALAAQQRLGHALQVRLDRVFGRWCVRAGGRSHETKSASYRLEPRKNPVNPPKPPHSGETEPRTEWGVYGVWGGFEISRSGDVVDESRCVTCDVLLPPGRDEWCAECEAGAYAQAEASEGDPVGAEGEDAVPF